MKGAGERGGGRNRGGEGGRGEVECHFPPTKVPWNEAWMQRQPNMAIIYQKLSMWN